MMVRLSGILAICAMMGMLLGCAPKDYVGDYCGKVNSCAKKAGSAFSVSECERGTNAWVEQSDTVGCGGEAEDYLSCVEGASCAEILDEYQNGNAPVECGAKVSAYNRCVN
jgi:hypothetical protein